MKNYSFSSRRVESALRNMPLIVFRPREIAYSLQLPLVSKTIIVANGCFDVACQFDFLLFQTIFPAIARHRRLAKTMDNVIVFHPISANCQQINCLKLKLTCCRSGVTPKSFRSSRELHSIKINYSILSSHIIVKKRSQTICSFYDQTSSSSPTSIFKYLLLHSLVETDSTTEKY